MTADYYDNAEFVEDGRTGMVAAHPPGFPAWDTSPEDVRKALPSIPAEFVRALTEKTAILIENPELRRRMGQAARAEVESGKFSLTRKNQKLKAIFDQAAASYCATQKEYGLR